MSKALRHIFFGFCSWSSCKASTLCDSFRVCFAFSFHTWTIFVNFWFDITCLIFFGLHIYFWAISLCVCDLIWFGFDLLVACLLLPFDVDLVDANFSYECSSGLWSMALGIQAKLNVILTKEFLGTHSYLIVLVGLDVFFVVFLVLLLIFGDGLDFVFYSTCLWTLEI